jgi:hypothetical protein
MSGIKACEGQWYTDRAHHDFFLVIAIDEFDLDEWDAMDLVLCGAPAQWDPFAEDDEDSDAHHFKSSGTT